MERVALQGAAQDEDLGGPLARGAPGELLGDVVGHPLVRRGGGGQDGRARGQLGEQGADASVVGAEVVPPVGDAVRLVDDDEPGAGRQVGQDLVAEDRVVEALGGHQQDVDVPGAHLRLDLVPLGGVGRVDGDGVDAGAPGGGDLVAHEGQQRGDDDARPGAGARAGGGDRGAVGPRTPALAQQDGGHEVDGGLAPAGALNHQRPAPADDQGLDGAPLVLAQRRVLAPHQRAQDGLGALADGGGGAGRGGVGMGVRPGRAGGDRGLRAHAVTLASPPPSPKPAEKTRDTGGSDMRFDASGCPPPRPLRPRLRPLRPRLRSFPSAAPLRPPLRSLFSYSEGWRGAVDGKRRSRRGSALLWSAERSAGTIGGAVRSADEAGSSGCAGWLAAHRACPVESLAGWSSGSVLAGAPELRHRPRARRGARRTPSDSDSGALGGSFRPAPRHIGVATAESCGNR